MAKCLNILEIVFGAWVLLSVPLLGCASAAPAVDLMAGALIVVLAGVSTGMKEYNPGCDWALVFVGCAFAVWGIADAAASLGGARSTRSSSGFWWRSSPSGPRASPRFTMARPSTIAGERPWWT